MESLNLSKAAFIETLKITSECKDDITFSRKFLHSIYDFCRIRHLHPDEATQSWTEEDDDILKENFPLAISKLAEGHQGMISMLRQDNIYTGKKFLSSIAFLDSDLKPLYLKALKEEEKVPENFEENFTTAMKAWNKLQWNIDEWSIPCIGFKKPNADEMPDLKGLSKKQHKWWFPNYSSFDDEV